MISIGRIFSRFFLMLVVLSGIGMVPSVALAQTPPPPPPTVGPAGGTTCNWYDLACQLMGDPAKTQANIAEAEKTVKAFGCWSCKVFNAFGNATFSSGRTASAQADAALKPVIVAVATLFSLFYMGSAFVSGDAGDLLGRWKVFWRLCIAVAVGTAWMSGSGSFEHTWNTVYGPIMLIPLAVEGAVPGAAASSGNCEAVPPPDAPSGATAVMARMAEVVCGANDISLHGIAMGIGLSNTGDGFTGTIVNVIAGIFLMIIFGWITITFPLRFIDVLLRLTVVGIVTPVLVVCAVFKPTRSYVQIGISNVLYAGSLFAFTGIMFKLGNAFMTKMFADAAKTFTGIGGGSAGQALANGIVLIGSGVIFSAMIRMAPSLASEFSAFRGQSGGVGDAASGFASTVVTMPVKGGAALAGGIGAKMAVTKAAGAMQKGAAAGAESGVASALGKSVT